MENEAGKIEEDEMAPATSRLSAVNKANKKMWISSAGIPIYIRGARRLASPRDRTPAHALVTPIKKKNKK
jgi:hypothetical protein